MTMRGKKPIIDAALLEIVHHEVREFTGRSPLRKREAGTQGAIVDDLVWAGAEALIRAAEHFDPSLGYTFQTYASKCVKHAIRRAARPRKRDALSRELLRLDARIQADDGLTTQHDVVADDTGDDFQISEAAWRCLQRLMPPREFDVLASRCVGFTRGKSASGSAFLLSVFGRSDKGRCGRSRNCIASIRNCDWRSTRLAFIESRWRTRWCGTYRPSSKLLGVPRQPATAGGRGWRISRAD